MTAGIYATSLSKLTVRGGDPLAHLSTAYELAAGIVWQSIKEGS